MIDDALELLDRRVEDRGASAGARADQDGVEAAHEIHGRGRYALDICRDGGVSRSETGFAVRLQSFNGFAQDAFAPARDENRGPFACHRFGAGKADAGSAAIDQRLLACQPAAQCLTPVRQIGLKTGSGKPGTATSVVNTAPPSGSLPSAACPEVTNSVRSSLPPRQHDVTLRAGSSNVSRRSPLGERRKTLPPSYMATQTQPSVSTQQPSGIPSASVNFWKTRRRVSVPAGSRSYARLCRPIESLK